MQAAAGSKGLNLASLRRVRRLWKEDVQRLTLADLRGIKGADHGLPYNLEVARQTHWEIKVRLAHRLRDFLFLPYKVMTHPAVRILYEKYVSTYLMHEDFGQLRSPDAATKYWLALAGAFEEHQHVTRLLGHSRRQLVGLDPALAPVLDTFLNRFFVSRIGTHLLGAHFLSIWPVPPGARKPAGVAMGVLQPTSPVGFLRDLAAAGGGVPVDVEEAAGAPCPNSILYIPGHLRGILRETMNNAVAATARAAAARGLDQPPPVRVKVQRGQFGVFVTIADRGDGISDAKDVWGWGSEIARAETASVVEADPDWTSGEAEGPARIPLGFGLPLARLTARYFGGDIRLQTLLGHGTNAYVHIPELRQEEAVVADDAGLPP